MNLVPILREILIWLVSILIAYIVWYPVSSVISYRDLPYGILGIVLIIQFARWFVFYEKVILFQRNSFKLLSIGLFPILGFILWSVSQSSISISENMELQDLARSHTSIPKLGFQETYDFFNYLRNLLILTGLGTPMMAMMVLLKILYRTIGMGSSKVKSFIKTTEK